MFMPKEGLRVLWYHDNFQTHFRLIHSFEFGAERDDYVFPATTYPWEIFTDSFSALGNPGFQQNRALLLEDVTLDASFFEQGLGKATNLTTN